MRKPFIIVVGPGRAGPCLAGSPSRECGSWSRSPRPRAEPVRQAGPVARRKTLPVRWGPRGAGCAGRCSNVLRGTLWHGLGGVCRRVSAFAAGGPDTEPSQRHCKTLPAQVGATRRMAAPGCAGCRCVGRRWSKTRLGRRGAWMRQVAQGGAGWRRGVRLGVRVGWGCRRFPRSRLAGPTT